MQSPPISNFDNVWRIHDETIVVIKQDDHFNFFRLFVLADFSHKTQMRRPTSLHTIDGA